MDNVQKCDIHVNIPLSPGLESREYGRGDPLGWPCDNLYPHKLALTLPTIGCRSVGIIRSRTKTTAFFISLSQTYKSYLLAIKMLSVIDNAINNEPFINSYTLQRHHQIQKDDL
jgi:hypothetical protein